MNFKGQPLSEEQMKMQTIGMRLLFFGLMEKEAGLTIKDYEKESIVRWSLEDLKRHINTHRIKQNSIDIFKLYGFFTYHTLMLLDRSSLDIRTVCGVVLRCLDSRLKRETSNRVSLDNKEASYIISMIEAEVSSAHQIGIGANGIGAVFQFMVRAHIKTKDFDLSTV